MNDSEFDIIIVGCGPSAIGLLYGILSRSDLSHLSVAVVDVGSKSDYHTNSAHQNESIRQWFQTSHPFAPWSGRRRGNVHSFMTVPQTHLGNRIIDVPVGIGHGGGTNINAGFCDGPLFCDHDVFHQEWPKPWSDGSLLNDAVEKLQHTMKQNGGLTTWNMCDEYARHFAAATRNTNRAPNNTEENTTFEKPLLPVGTEYNYVTSFPIATNNQFERINYFDSLLSPLLLTTTEAARDRITFISNAAVYQIIIEDNQAIGIKYKDTIRAKTDEVHDVFTTLNAKKEIFLCAGAIVSPALLLASGLGDKEQLQKSNIVPASGHDDRGNLPHVGKHLKDHVLLPRCFFTPINQWGVKKSSNCCQAKYNIRIPRKATTSNEDNATSTTESRNEETSMSQNYQFMLTDGAVSLDVLPYFLASYVRRGMHIQLDDSRAIVLMKKNINTLCNNLFLILRFLLWIIFSYIPLARILVQQFTSTINICHMNPTSEGTIAVRKHYLGSAQPQQQRGNLLLNDIEILIDLCYMSNPSDYDAMHTAWHVSDVIRAQHFSNCFEVLPGLLYRWRSMIRRRGGIVSSSTTKPLSHHGMKQKQEVDIWLRTYIRDFTLPYYHWCGTCRMGKTAQDSVVNSSLQVHGISGLRVCDASVFPTCISSPIALTCAAIGYVAASFLTP